MNSIYCGNDESRKNNDDEYFKEIFCKAVRDFIDYLFEKNKSLLSTEVKKETANKGVDN